MRILFLLILLPYLLFANSNYIDSISLAKVKKLVKKEEEIAKAYKEYIVDMASTPISIAVLIRSKHLDAGFDSKNLFNREINILSESNQIENVLPKKIKYKSNIYDYYYSNKNRKYSIAPLSSQNNNVNISLDSREKFIIKHKDSIVTVKTSARNKFHLDKGILTWYDNDGNFKFSITKKFDLLADGSIGEPGTASFTSFFSDKDVLQSGQTTYSIGDSAIDEYVNLGENAGFIKIGEDERQIAKTIVQFTRRSGGMLVNGNIYTWGNVGKRIVGIDKNTYYNSSGSSSNSDKYPVVTTLIRQKAKLYDDDTADNIDYDFMDSKNYLSSPLRPYFIDFFATVFHNTCGVTRKGELYCNGSTGTQYSFGYSYNNIEKSGDDTKELLYRSKYFDGSTNSKSAVKVFANNQLWLILGKDGRIYRWGYDFRGFSGNGSRYFNYSDRDYSKQPESVNVSNSGAEVLFDDITYLLTVGYRKMGALSSAGDIYIWGVESQNSDGLDCTEEWEGVDINLCAPLKVSSSVKFKSVKGMLDSFIALGTDDKYYKIYQRKYELPKVESIDDIINGYSASNVGSDPLNKFITEDDNQILAVDISSKLNGTSLESGWNTGIVWVNGKNQLKGDYFSYSNKDDKFFIEAIRRIKWKNIKVVEDDNGMCGIDIFNQMYCWGTMSYFRTGEDSTYNTVGNTFMVPTFNTNLFDLDKDYLVVEGGENGILTSMTSGEWRKDNVPAGGEGGTRNGAFFMKYPTYIGGFNYEFEFK